MQLRGRRSRSLLLDGVQLTVRVRESARARRARITVGPSRPLEIIVPRGLRADEIDRLLEARRSWIRANLARAAEIANRPKWFQLDAPGFVPLAGEAVPLERLDGARSVAELRGGRLLVRGPDENAGAALRRWYRREARRRIGDVVAREAARLGSEYRSVSIRDQRTRWGSCSSSGNLSFSWRLLLAPPTVLDYVVVHELSHLREPNHSKAFWRLLDAVLPGWPEPARWLREFGHELHAFRPDALLG